MDVFARASGSRFQVPARLRRPAGIAEGTRWLFAVLAIISLLIALPAPPMSQRDVDVDLLALVTGAALVASNVYVYLTRRLPFVLDLCDSVAITGFALACPDPSIIVGYVFASVWFRSLYHSGWRPMVRCALYGTALTATLPLWTLMPGHQTAPSTGAMVSILPAMAITFIVARELGRGLQAREESLRRDDALAATGSQLLRVTDVAAIHAIAWTALAEVCSATPGLRVLKVVRADEVLVVDGAAGEYHALPTTVPAAAMIIGSDARSARVGDPLPLDAAVGTTLCWVCIHLSMQGDAWLLLGAPSKASADAVLVVRSVINQVSLALHNSQVHAQLTAAARVDALTGLANRTSFTADLSAYLANRTRTETLHMLFVDLDGFKDVNDILGHRAGDALLTEIATRLRGCTRPADLCARLGGDEFAVALRATTEADVAVIAQRIVDRIAEPVDLGGRTARVGASVGIATGSPQVDVEELLHRADLAMYAAKAHGKGRVQRFNPGLVKSGAPTSTAVSRRSSGPVVSPAGAVLAP